MLIQARTKRQIVKHEQFENNVMKAFEEVDKILCYYKNEVRQLEHSIKEGDMSKEEKIYQMAQKATTKDIVEELQFIHDVMRGLHLEMEAKK